MATGSKPNNTKVIIYQMMTRLFGNINDTNKPWGTIEENGVGKFSDLTEKALKEIKELGITHIWYTGVAHHDVITDYTQYGISNDDHVTVGKKRYAVQCSGEDCRHRRNH